jgi:hypothetical protein
LSLRGCSQVDNDILHGLSQNSLTRAAALCPSSLLPCDRDPGDIDSARGEGVAYPSSSRSARIGLIKTLDIHGCTSVSDITMLKWIPHVNTGGCWRIKR